MEYKQDDGKVLKGFSQIDLDELNKKITENDVLMKKQTEEIRRQRIQNGILIGIAVVYVLWLTWYVMHYGVVNNILAHCG